MNLKVCSFTNRNEISFDTNVIALKRIEIMDELLLLLLKVTTKKRINENTKSLKTRKKNKTKKLKDAIIQ